MESFFDSLNTEFLAALSSLANLFESFDVKGSSTGALFNSLRKEIVEHFGDNGLYAAYIACGAIALYAGAKILKITYTVVRLVVLPSVALAFVGSFFLPMSFFYLLPVTVSLSSVWLLVRG